jgi:surface polysaccharide O-acyltransferase-like enzyme
MDLRPGAGKMIRHLLLLNGLAVLAVVGQHASGWGFTAMFWWTGRYQPVTAIPDFGELGSATYYALRALEQLTIFAPPAFLFVSGFFVAFAAGPQGLNLTWNKVSSRIRTLLIPYLIWSLLILAWRAVEGQTDTPAGYLDKLIFGRAVEPYYYIPLIIQIYLVSPFLVRWLKASWKPVLIAAGVIQTATLLARYPVYLGWDLPAATWVVRHTPGWFFPQTAFWFVFGVFAGFHLPLFKQWLARWERTLPWLTVALGVLAFLEWELLLRLSGRAWLSPGPTVLDSLFSCAVILTCLAFAHLNMPLRRHLDVLGERSFGVYLVHAPVIEVAARGVYHAAPDMLAFQFPFQMLLLVVGLGVPMVLMAMVSRSPARAYYNYLFG